MKETATHLYYEVGFSFFRKHKCNKILIAFDERQDLHLSVTLVMLRPIKGKPIHL